MRRMKLLVNWMYRLLTLLVVALAVFSGELFITRANILNSSIPKSCVLVDDKTKTTQLKLSGPSHLDPGTKNKLAAVFKADPNGQSSIGLDCKATSTPKPKPKPTPTSAPAPTPTPTPTVLHALTIDDLQQYCQSKGYNNVSPQVDPNGVRTGIFFCAGGATGDSDPGVTHTINIDTGDLTYVEACQSHVPGGTAVQARYDGGQQLWDCVG
jgi:hypothetical protein